MIAAIAGKVVEIEAPRPPEGTEEVNDIVVAIGQSQPRPGGGLPVGGGPPLGRIAGASGRLRGYARFMPIYWIYALTWVTHAKKLKPHLNLSPV